MGTRSVGCGGDFKCARRRLLVFSRDQITDGLYKQAMVLGKRGTRAKGERMKLFPACSSREQRGSLNVPPEHRSDIDATRILFPSLVACGPEACLEENIDRMRVVATYTRRRFLEMKLMKGRWRWWRRWMLWCCCTRQVEVHEILGRDGPGLGKDLRFAGNA